MAKKPRDKKPNEQLLQEKQPLIDNPHLSPEDRKKYENLDKKD